MEIMAALVILASLAAVSARVLSSTAFRSADSQVTARMIHHELERQRSTSMATLENCGLQFVRRGGQITRIESFRRGASGRPQSTGLRLDIPADVDVRCSVAGVEFTAAGSATAGTRIEVHTASRQWQIEVFAATGLSRLTVSR